MTLNDVLTKQNLITKVLLANDGKELSKELKVKIMRVRLAYNKIKKQFDEDTQEFSKQIVSDELRDLANKNNDSWWGGNPLWTNNYGANRITVCIFGHVKYK